MWVSPIRWGPMRPGGLTNAYGKRCFSNHMVSNGSARSYIMACYTDIAHGNMLNGTGFIVFFMGTSHLWRARRPTFAFDKNRQQLYFLTKPAPKRVEIESGILSLDSDTSSRCPF